MNENDYQLGGDFIFRLAFFNVAQRKGQSFITIAITMVAVFTFILTFSVLYLVNTGIEISRKRIGADVMVIASNSEFDDSQFLYSGKPTTRYIDLKDLEFLNQYSNEIEATTEQFFTNTLSAGCCTVGEKLRIVGIDQETDFLIKPWLEEHDIEKISNSQVIIGDDVAYPLGARMGLLGQTFELVGSLYRTGTGMDRTIFMDIKVARKLAKERIQASVFKGKETSELATSVFIKLKDGVNPRDFANKINADQDNVKATAKADAISKMEDAINGWILIVLFLIVAVVLNAILSLFGRFDAIIKERKKEIGYLRSLGVSKGSILKLALYEVGITSIVGGVAGSLLVLVTISGVIDRVTEQFTLPSASLTPVVMVGIFVSGPLFAFLLSFISSIIPAIKSANLEPKEAMTRGEI